MDALKESRLVRNEGLWKARGKYYLRKYSSLPSELIRVDPKLFELAAELMGEAAPKLREAFDTHLGELSLKALDEWPVDTGLSKSLLSLEYTVDGAGTRFTGRLLSRAPYTVFIKGQPHRTLIDRPSQAVADRIATDAILELSRGK